MTACKDCKHLIKEGPYGFEPENFTIFECHASPNDLEFDSYSGEFIVPKRQYKSVYAVNFGNCPKFYERRADAETPTEGGDSGCFRGSF